MFDPGPFAERVTLRSGQAALQHDTGDCFVDFIAGGPVLVVSFEGAGPQRYRPDGLRDCWGQMFVQRLGHSVLGIKPRWVDWYRGAGLHAFFRSPALAAWTRQFERVVLFGTSMGGFGALAFAEAFPGCTVIAHNPQSTLAPGRVPWETRFHEARALDWSGEFADGAEAGRHAGTVYMTYDPFHPLDRRHVDRVRGANVQALRVPLVGHGTPEWLNKMGVLRPLTVAAMAGALTPVAFARAVRARRGLARYYVRLAEQNRHPPVRRWALARAAAIEPDNGELIGREITEQLAQDEFASCIAAYRRSPALTGLPNAKRPEVLAAVALAMTRAGETPDEAAALAGQAEALAFESVQALLLLARLRMLQGDGAAAVRHLARALELKPGHGEAAKLLARAQAA